MFLVLCFGIFNISNSQENSGIPGPRPSDCVNCRSNGWIKNYLKIDICPNVPNQPGCQAIVTYFVPFNDSTDPYNCHGCEIYIGEIEIPNGTCLCTSNINIFDLASVLCAKKYVVGNPVCNAGTIQSVNSTCYEKVLNLPTVQNQNPNGYKLKPCGTSCCRRYISFFYNSTGVRVPRIWKTERIGINDNCLPEIPIQNWVPGLCFDTNCEVPINDGDGSLAINNKK